jgi:hypothetical protein
MGYHTREIKKGEFGEFSKVQEEWEELLDARLQDGKILELVEIADLYGAIEGYLEKQYGMSMEDVAKMSHMTKTAFLEGKRTATIVLDSKDVQTVTPCYYCSKWGPCPGCRDKK